MTIVCTHKPSKSNPERVRLCVGGDRLEYDGNIRTPTADLTTVKILLNSTISTKEAKFMTIYIKTFYLGTPMEVYEYGRFHRKDIPQVFIDQYKLEPMFDNKDFVYMEIQRGMYGLKQAGKIANDQLKERLIPHGYRPCRNTPGLWRHDKKPISFTLIFDNFGVKYTQKRDAEHLLSILRKEYEAVTTDWTGTLYSGITLKWDYILRKVHTSMPGYIGKALHQFQHKPPEKITFTSHPYTPPTYGLKVQMAKRESEEPLLDKKDNTRVRQVVGKVLFYARAINSNLLMGLNTIASQQENATARTALLVTHILNYCATYPDAILTYGRYMEIKHR